MAEIKGDGAIKRRLDTDDNAKFEKGLQAPYLELIDQKGKANAGGSFTAGSWQNRALTTAIYNDFAVVALFDEFGQWTVPAGTYYIEASAPAWEVNEHVARLADMTTNSAGDTVVLGTAEFSADPDVWLDSAGQPMTALTVRTSQTRSIVEGQFTLPVASKLELQHKCSVTRNTDGFGTAANFYTGPVVDGDVSNVFSVVKMWQLFYVGGRITPDVPILPVNASLNLAATGPEWVTTVGGAANSIDFGIPNSSGEVTILAWVKATSAAFDNRVVFGLGKLGAGGENGYYLEHNVLSGTLRVHVINLTNSTKVYRHSSASVSTGVWFMFGLTFDGLNAADSLKIYYNGVVDATPTKDLDADVSGMTPSDMQGAIGATGALGSAAFHKIFSVATWNEALTAAEILAIYNGGDPSNFDITKDSGNYTSSANLKSWYLPGKNLAGGFGEDFGPQGADMTVETNVDNTNRDADTPP